MDGSTHLLVIADTCIMILLFASSRMGGELQAKQQREEPVAGGNHGSTMYPFGRQTTNGSRYLQESVTKRTRTTARFDKFLDILYSPRSLNTRQLADGQFS